MGELLFHLTFFLSLACIFGDVTKIDTTGASEATARQDKLNVKGVAASYKLAEHDLKRMEQYKNIIKKVGAAKQMEPAVIAAIISRESRAGAALVNGWGDHGNGFGLMQVDKRYHTPRGAWNSEEHLIQGTEILINSIKAIQKKFPTWPKEHQFKGSQTFFYMSLLASVFGDVTKIDTTGASEATARQDKLTVKGVEASYKLAEHDLKGMEKYKTIIKKVGTGKQMEPAVIAAIISRESRAGAALVNGWGDHGNGFGLMQVDKRYHTPRGAWNSEEHLIQGTDILTDSIKAIQKKFPTWPKEHQFKGGISAYNAGVSNVRSYEHMDLGTTGNDYANDVVARAQWYKRHGY